MRQEKKMATSFLSIFWAAQYESIGVVEKEGISVESDEDATWPVEEGDE